MPGLTQTDRAQLRDILRAVDDAALSARRAVRTYRNILIAATVALSAIAVSFPFVAAQISPELVVIRTSGGQSSQSLAIAMGTIELWGLLGALLAATAGLPRLRSSRSPYGLQVAQSVLKLPTGALTALFGIVLLQSGILPPLTTVHDSTLAAYAGIFGFAQEALTHFIDRRASDLLLKAEPLTGEEA
jgi:hypothetical protein